MKDVILLFPFNQSVKHIRGLCDHVQQLRVTGVGTEPGAYTQLLLMERIDEKCRQSGIGFIHKEAGGILWADINACLLYTSHNRFQRSTTLIGFSKAERKTLRSMTGKRTSLALNGLLLSLIHI